MSIQLLAITPPSGPVEASVIDIWEAAGILGDPPEPRINLNGAPETRVGTSVFFALLLRQPGASPADLVGGRLQEIVAACRRRGIPLLVSVDPDRLREGIATVADHGLAGMQLRGDPSREVLARARDALGGRVLGRSVHGADGDVGTNHDLVDYSCFAPVFTPRTGPAKAAAGLDALRSWTADVGAHVLALGGVTASNAGECLRAGARGVASIATFLGPPPVVVEDLSHLARQCSAAPSPKKNRRDGDDATDRGRPASRG